MFDDLEPKTKKSNEITLNCDLSEFSVSDIEERITLLAEEISRLEQEKRTKTNSLAAAESFFKSS